MGVRPTRVNLPEKIPANCGPLPLEAQPFTFYFGSSPSLRPCFSGGPRQCRARPPRRSRPCCKSKRDSISFHQKNKNKIYLLHPVQYQIVQNSPFVTSAPAAAVAKGEGVPPCHSEALPTHLRRVIKIEMKVFIHLAVP